MKPKKNILKAGLLTLLLLSVGFAQTSFVFEHQDTSVTGTDEFYEFEGYIINTSGDTLNLTVVRQPLIEPPLDWSCSMCVVFCLPPFIDSYDFTLAPSDSAWFALDVYPFDVAGTGRWSIIVIDSSTMAADTASYSVTYGSTSLRGETVSLKDNEIVSAYPNPANAAFTTLLRNLNAGNFQIALYDISGREIMNKQIIIQPNQAKYRLLWDASELSSGVYTVRVQGEQQSWIQHLTIVK